MSLKDRQRAYNVS